MWPISSSGARSQKFLLRSFHLEESQAFSQDRNSREGVRRKNSLACTPALSLFFPPRMFFKAKESKRVSQIPWNCSYRSLSHRGDTGNRTEVLWESISCFEPLSHLYSPISVPSLLSHHWRSFLLHWMGTNTETHRETLCRARDFGTLSPKWDVFHQIPPLRALGTPQKRGQKKCKSQKGWRAPRKQDPLHHHDQSS
ncbi:uncharacterized protein LOC121822864 isoform X1 [Peromyscus maniculatus bairdii]|uniref:uncharacterized protein LOC121822864 isoform X1 n=1 Tax=Peromyscus maniculatus bairdii TaxID=230844 RepID=UPI003FCEEF65